jgi:PKHD-type hydroxylase
MYLLRQNLDVVPYYIKENFLNDQEIKKITEIISNIEPQDGLIGTDIDDYVKDDLNRHIKNLDVGHVEHTRRSTLRWIELNETSQWLYKKIIQTIKEVNAVNFDYILTFMEMLQFTEYSEKYNGMYKKHNDCGDISHIDNSVDIRKVSFSIQLSDTEDYEGGDLILYDRDETGFKKMTREKGSIIFFLSNIEHEVTPVVKGTRYSLVSWVNGPNLR